MMYYDYLVKKFYKKYYLKKDYIFKNRVCINDYIK